MPSRGVPDVDAVTHDPVQPLELVSLAELAATTGLQPPAGGNWPAELTRRGIDVHTDDLDRPAITRVDARRLIAEQRDAQQRQRELADQHNAQLEQQRLASLRGGIPADQIPEGVLPAAAILQAAKDAERQRRTTPPSRSHRMREVTGTGGSRRGSGSA